MEIHEIRLSYANLQNLLIQRRIKDALDLLHSAAKSSQVSLLIDEIYSVEQSYRYMLTFLLEGHKDPNKETPYNLLIKNIFVLADKIYSELFFSFFKRNLYEIENIDFSNFQINNLISKLNTNQPNDEGSREAAISSLFNILAFSPLLSGEIIHNIEVLLIESPLSSAEKSTLSVALFISALNNYDDTRVNLMLSLLSSKDINLSSRALVHVLIVFTKYNSRLHFFEDTLKKWEAFCLNPINQNKVKSTLFQLLKAKETEKISKKFTDEILPEMIKINPIIKKKLDLDNLLSDSQKKDDMPDWEDLLNDSPELMDKIDEINKMQQEGFDLLSSTFKHLKHFDFFNTLSNWFQPFSTQQSEVQKILKSPIGEKLQGIASLVNRLPNMCNSDKYSIFFAMQSIPMIQNELFNKFQNGELSDEANMLQEEMTLSPEKAFVNNANLYIQDLYRFFTIYQNKHFFDNIFTFDFVFFKYQFFSTCFKDTAILKEFGNYYFKNQYYKEAAELFELYNSTNEPQVDVLQKIGYSYQQCGRFDDALKYYLQADFFEQNRLWNLRKIALCYRNLNNIEKALEYYQLAALENPDNLSVQASIGQCYMELQNYEEALKSYFKVEFLAPGNTKVWRPIAWCSYALTKFDVSETYFEKLLALKEPTSTDIMSYGHLKWAMGQKREAVQLLKKSLKSPNFTLEQFIEIFNQEAVILKKHGIDEIEIATLLDQVRYEVDSKI